MSESTPKPVDATLDARLRARASAGTVYLAEQHEPVRRTVALKL